MPGATLVHSKHSELAILTVTIIISFLPLPRAEKCSKMEKVSGDSLESSSFVSSS